MKKIILLFILCFLLLITSVNASLPLSGKLIIIDVGHGSKDNGTSYNDLLEKNLNLDISKKLEEELIKQGASVILTREKDYDLSSPNTKRRKKSDFDNRIEFINNSNADLYLSIHINNLPNEKYYGAQVFYLNDNKQLAETIQKHLNKISYPRSIKKIKDLYMYDKINIKGVLIECGFISNNNERRKLQSEEYKKEIANTITNGIIEYYN